MNQLVKFINREEEMKAATHLIHEWGATQFLVINGAGGIGKTRFVQEIRQYCGRRNSVPFPLLVTEIIDLDDIKYQLPQNIGRKIAADLDQKNFGPYVEALSAWRQTERADASQERLQESIERVNRAFVDCFNRLSQHTRIVVMVDTLDTPDETDALVYLIEMGQKLANCVFILSGRNALQASARLHQSQAKVLTIDLKPLSRAASETYLREKESTRHLFVEPDLAQKLLLLAGGKPILIDLAVEWRARGISLDWLVNRGLEEIKSFSDQALEAHRAEFEFQLVRPIADTRHNIDWLVLVMARVYPIDTRMIAKLLTVEDSEAAALFEEASRLVFIKVHPNGTLTLHDEMRRMVLEYLWPIVDPDGERQRRDSRLVVRDLDERMAAISEQLEALRTPALGGDELAAQSQLRVFLEREALARELWANKAQQLGHRFQVDISEGVEAFQGMFDEATNSYQFPERGPLVAQAQQYRDKMTPAQRYVLDNRRVKLLLDGVDYDHAKQLVEEILARSDLLPEQRIDMLIQHGNIEVRLGNLEAAVAEFEQAVALSEQHQLAPSLVKALNARGWARRNQGYLRLALKDYVEASKLSTQLKDRKGSAWILNNMGYVHALLGERQAAFEKCNSALALWQKLDFGRGLGATYSNLGEIYKRFDQLDEALKCFNKALDIFTAENDVEWQSTARCGRASVLWKMQELEQAADDLAWALSNGPKNLKPRVLYYQGLLAKSRSERSTAISKFEESRIVSQNIGDRFFDYVNFSMLIEMAFDNGQYGRWQAFHEEHTWRYRDWDDELDRRLRGTTLRRIADLAICDGAYDTAVRLYQESLPLITRYEVRDSFVIGAQLKAIQEHVRKVLPVETLKALGTDLARFWNTNSDLVTSYPEVLFTFDDWAEGSEQA